MLYFENHMNSQEYLNQTETAVQQLFTAKEYYTDQLKGAIGPTFISGETDEEKRENEFRAWQEENKEKIATAIDNQTAYFGLTTSNATICGSILQIAFTGIKSFSINSDIPATFNKFIPANKDDNRQIFCVGREIRNIPIGMIINAARNQYNHMDEGLSNKLSIFVFDTLAEYHTGGKYKDPSFDLENPILNNYSHNILALLEWNDYEAYLADMKKMI